MDPISPASMKEITDMVLTQQLMPEQWKKDYIVAKKKKRGTKEPAQQRNLPHKHHGNMANADSDKK
eukprot:8115131-Prorocentrum_lima.AAC.1